MNIQIGDQLDGQVTFTDGRQTLTVTNQWVGILSEMFADLSQWGPPHDRQRIEEVIWMPRHATIKPEDAQASWRIIPTQVDYYTVPQTVIIDSVLAETLTIRVLAELPTLGRTARTLKWEREGLTRALRAARVAIRLRESMRNDGPQVAMY